MFRKSSTILNFLCTPDCRDVITEYFHHLLGHKTKLEGSGHRWPRIEKNLLEIKDPECLRRNSTKYKLKKIVRFQILATIIMAG